MSIQNSQAVIFIPGLKGTTLVNTNRSDYDTIWSAIQSEFEDIEMLELSLDNQGNAVDSWPETLIHPGQIEGLAYGEFLRDMNDDKPIYLFNYDWRQTSLSNAIRLQAFMDMLIRKSKSSKRFTQSIKRFDVITHSHGSAIARQLTSLEGFKRIARVILVAPPLVGALDTVDVVLTGEGFFPGVRANIRKLIRTFPGALELLPRYQSALFADNVNVDFFDINHWQANVTEKSNSYAAKFKTALHFAKQSVMELDDWSKLRKPLRDRVLIIARDGYKTAQSVNVVKKSSEPDNFVKLDNIHYSTSGDSRVPHASSCIWYNKITTLMASDSWRYRDYGHAFILKDERVQKVIRRFLSEGSNFSWEIPGHSIKQVVALNRVALDRTSHSYNLSSWDVELK